MNLHLPYIFSYISFWILLSHRALSFTAFPVFNHANLQLCRDHSVQRTHAFALPATGTTKDVEDDFIEAYEDESAEDDMDDKSEIELVLQFVEIVQNSPPGELQVEEIDLLRKIMADFPTDDVDGLEPAQVMESLLHRLLDEWKAALHADDSEKEEAFRPEARDFSHAISAWEKSDNPDRVIHVLSLLSDQRELFMNGLTTVQPELSSIKNIMHILVQSRERGVDKRASQVFESLADYGLVADPDIYGLMVTAIAKSRTRGAAKRAEKVLREGVKLYPPQMVDGIKSGIGSNIFNAIITSHAKGNEENGPEQAEQLIVLMDQLDSDHGSLGICSPNVNTFTSLIDAYAQRNEWEAASQADRILNRLLDQYLDGNEDLEPNVATWTIVISAWARLSKNNRKGAAERAGRLLRRMEDLYQDGRISFKPDAITYVTCMNAAAFSKNGVGAPEAERLLEEMNEMYLDADDSMKPSARSIKVVADSWIKAGDMERAEDLLDRYEDVLLSDDSPKVFLELKDVYRSMLFGYTQQDDTERAKFYLNYMIEKGLQPDSDCFDRIIDANTRINAEDSLKNSLEVFEVMEKCRRSGDIEPNERMYTSFIRALTKGRAPGLHKKASFLLQRMHNLHEAGNKDIKPTVFTYNLVLNACAESRHVEDTPLAEAFKTAVRVFTELRSDSREQPNHLTYGNLLRCAVLLSEGEKRDKFVSATFRSCCEQGYVNTFVVRDLQNSASEKIWRSLLRCPEGEVDMGFLPADWSTMVNKGNEKAKSMVDRRNEKGKNRGRR